MGKQILRYHLCPRCYRATPASVKEMYCPNEGTKLLTACPNCAAPISSPYNRFCAACGQGFSPTISQLVRKE